MSTSLFVAQLPNIVAGFACQVAFTESSFAIELPLLEANFESNYTHSTFAIEFPLIEVSFVNANSQSSFTVELPLIECAFNCGLTRSYFAAELPKIRASFAGVSNSFSIIDISLPLIEAAFTAANNTFSTLDISLPKLVVEFVSDGGIVYQCLVLHNEIAFTDWEFAATMNSIAEFDGDVYIASPSGLFTLGGSDDNGTDIDATVQLGLSDGGIPNFKQGLGYYLSLRSNGKIQLQMIADDESDIAIHDIRTTENKIKTRWAMTERGPRGRFLGAKIINVDGCDFRIKSLDIPVKLLFTKQTQK